MLRRFTALSLTLFCLAVQAQSGLRWPEEPQLAARLNLMAGDEPGGSRLLAAQLIGDYYLIGQGNGLRLSGGLMVGPASLTGTGLAPVRPGVLGVGMRRLLGNSDEERIHQPYLGLGYSRFSSAWGFTADLGVAVRGGGSGLRTDSSSAFAQSLDDSLRRLQWTPMVQLGLSYRF
jgi:hypothetical protein